MNIGISLYRHNVTIADTFKGYETHASSESQKQLNSDYAYQPDQTLQSYPSAVDSFTISCSGKNKICVAKSLCVNGYVHPLKQGFIRPGQVRQPILFLVVIPINNFIAFTFLIKV